MSVDKCLESLLGIDESGRKREFFVGVYSLIQSDSYSSRFNKNEVRKSEDNINKIIGKRDFRYLFFEKEKLRRLCSKKGENKQLIVISEFISVFSEEIGDLDRVYMDGNLREGTKDSIMKILEYKEVYRPELICEPRADERYRVVSKADHLASLLRKHYLKEEEKSKGSFNANKYVSPYQDKIIIPNLNFYEKRLQDMNRL